MSLRFQLKMEEEDRVCSSVPPTSVLRQPASYVHGQNAWFLVTDLLPAGSIPKIGFRTSSLRARLRICVVYLASKFSPLKLRYLGTACLRIKLRNRKLCQMCLFCSLRPTVCDASFKALSEKQISSRGNPYLLLLNCPKVMKVDLKFFYFQSFWIWLQIYSGLKVLIPGFKILQDQKSNSSSQKLA